MMPVPVTMAVPGDIAGELCVLSRPLSLWGGYDVARGTIIDIMHPERSITLAGRILAMTEARGSSSSSSTLVEAARCGTAPAAIILARLDPILVIGSLVAADLYGIVIPVGIVSMADWHKLVTGTWVTVDTAASALTPVMAAGQ